VEFSLFIAMAVIFWGLAPIFSKLGLKKLDPMLALTIRTLVIAVIMLVVCAVTGKIADIGHVRSKDILLISAEGIFAAILGQFAYYAALKLGDASKVAPLVAVYPAVTVLAAILFLGEKLTWNKVTGLVIIIVGIFIIKK
jgi:transporter family protein